MTSIGAGAGRPVTLEEELTAGTYTITASTWGEVGSFTLTLDVSGGGVGGGKQLTVSNVVFDPNPADNDPYVVTAVVTNTGREVIDLFRHNVRFYRADGTLLREQIGRYLGEDVNVGDRLELSIHVTTGQQEALGWDYFSLYFVESFAEGPVPCVGCDERYPAPPREPCGIPFDEGLMVTQQCSNGGWWASGPLHTLSSFCFSDTEEEARDSVMYDGFSLRRIGTADWSWSSGDVQRGTRLWRTGYALWSYDNDARDRLSNISCFR